MELNREEEKTLAGEAGEAKQLAMQILTKVGDAVGADSLTPIVSAHVLAHYSSLHEAGIDVLEKFAKSGGKFGVPTTVDPASIDLENWRSFGIRTEYAEKQLRLCEAYSKMGGIQCWSCVQYQVCNFPKPGENVAWAESSSVVFANSVIGCRSNKITSGLDIASAVLGMTPRFGMLIDENRAPGLRINVDFPLRSELDLRSIGYYVGKNSGARVPLLSGLPSGVSSDDLKHLGAAAAASGPVTMIHFPGITPAPPRGPNAAEESETIDISPADLLSVEDELNQTDEAPDLVALGVPHLSINELGLVAKLLGGRTLKGGISMYVYTSSQSYEMAELSGIRREIEAVGARLTHSTDAEISPLKALGFNVVQTNSAKLAEIVSAEGEIKTRYAPLRTIISEVTT